MRLVANNFQHVMPMRVNFRVLCPCVRRKFVDWDVPATMGSYLLVSRLIETAFAQATPSMPNIAAGTSQSTNFRLTQGQSTLKFRLMARYYRSTNAVSQTNLRTTIPRQQAVISCGHDQTAVSKVHCLSHLT